MRYCIQQKCPKTEGNKWYMCMYMNQAVPKVGEFKIASSINDLNVGKDSSSVDEWSGRKSTLPQVLLFGRTSSQNWIVGVGWNPRGGISSAPVANMRISFRVEPELPSLQTEKEKCIHALMWESVYQTLQTEQFRNMLGWVYCTVFSLSIISISLEYWNV